MNHFDSFAQIWLKPQLDDRLICHFFLMCFHKYLPMSTEYWRVLSKTLLIFVLLLSFIKIKLIIIKIVKIFLWKPFTYFLNRSNVLISMFLLINYFGYAKSFSEKFQVIVVPIEIHSKFYILKFEENPKTLWQ